jgi:hypothetical protein
MSSTGSVPTSRSTLASQEVSNFGHGFAAAGPVAEEGTIHANDVMQNSGASFAFSKRPLSYVWRGSWSIGSGLL